MLRAMAFCLLFGISLANAETSKRGSEKTITGDEAYTTVKKLSVRDPSFEQFLNKLIKCADKKDVVCLAKFGNDNELIKKMFKYVEIAETPKYCKIFKSKEGNDTNRMDEIIAEYNVQDSPLLWIKFSEVIQLYKKDINVTLITDKFNTPREILIEKNYSRELPCDNQVDLRLRFKKVAAEWKIKEFVTYSRTK